MTGRPQAVPNQRAGEKFSGSFLKHSTWNVLVKRVLDYSPNSICGKPSGFAAGSFNCGII